MDGPRAGLRNEQLAPGSSAPGPPARVFLGARAGKLIRVSPVPVLVLVLVLPA